MSNIDSIAVDRLVSFISHIERLEDEKRGIMDDIKDIFTDLASTGFDKKAVRTVIKLRKQDKDKREQEQAILETYMSAIGLD